MDRTLFQNDIIRAFTYTLTKRRSGNMTNPKRTVNNENNLKTSQNILKKLECFHFVFSSCRKWPLGDGLRIDDGWNKLITV